VSSKYLMYELQELIIIRDFVKFRGLPARQFLKTVAYKDQIPQFKTVLADIGKSQDWSLDDLKARFSNELWDEMVFS
jgi:hypothetical protein